MIFLPSTTSKLQLITSAAGQIDVWASYADLSGSSVSASAQVRRINTATTTDIVDPPAASTVRNIKNLKIGNNHGSVSNTVTLQITDGTNTFSIETVTLAPGERIGYEEGVGLRVFDSSGREKVTTAGDRAAQGSTAAQGPGFAADTYITGSAFPITGRVQPGSFFRWTLQVTKTAAGTAAPIFVVRTGTAGSTADTARCTLTLAAQSATAADNYYTLEAEFRSVGAGTAAVIAGIAMGETNFSTAPGGVDQAVSGGFDSTAAGLLIGLSVNGGTSAAWTIQSVTLDAKNLVS